MGVTTFLQHGAQRPGLSEQVDAMLPHLPPALCVLGHDRMGCDSWGVSGDSRSSKELLQEKSQLTACPLVILW